MKLKSKDIALQFKKSYNNEHQCQVCCEFVKTANRQRVV
ncbi:hypothetical protein D917_10676, partial [Trichinella nativa]